MAENMSKSHDPDEKFSKAYGQWADGGWGMVLTGTFVPRSRRITS
jgi:2,4-dienoyl-CoA reductase-like NADH-dependent reductase (Old Yellow Enzyme family)